MRRVSAWAKKMADREEGRQAFLFNNLGGLTRPGAVIEIQRDFLCLANGQNRKSATKNPASVAAHGGAHHGSTKQSEQATPYRKNGALS